MAAFRTEELPLVSYDAQRLVHRFQMRCSLLGKQIEWDLTFLIGASEVDRLDRKEVEIALSLALQRLGIRRIGRRTTAVNFVISRHRGLKTRLGYHKL